MNSRILLSMTVILSALLLKSHTISAQSLTPNQERKSVIADKKLLQAIDANILAEEPISGVAYSTITATQEQRLNEMAHDMGSCAGFELLGHTEVAPTSLILSHVFSKLIHQEVKNRKYQRLQNSFSIEPRPMIQAALEEVSVDHIKQSVEFLSNYENRYHKSPGANQSIEEFKSHIVQTLENSDLNYEIELIPHLSTPQKSIQVRVPGQQRPDEIIVIGGHIDSTSRSWFGAKKAPGADDNASGSANILEALRVLSKLGPQERTIEFFWYAGEEGGLLGSAEIAQNYRNENKDIIAVIQLDMTLFPGEGNDTIVSMSDFTSAWLRDYLYKVNSTYLGLNILEDKCGYGCSDHATWYRQGYPTLMPTEARLRRMNRHIHTERDQINSESDFLYSATFSKLVLALALELANSDTREPQ